MKFPFLDLMLKDKRRISIFYLDLRKEFPGHCGESFITPQLKGLIRLDLGR